MINYDFRGRLQYIPGGALNVQMSAWPVAGANWWEPTTGSFTCVAAYQAKGAASLAASYVNLANPGTYDLVLRNSAPTFDTADGWTFNGTNQRLGTTITGASNLSMIVRYSELDGAKSPNYIAGGYGASNSRYFVMSNQSGYSYFGVGTAKNFSGLLTSGVAVISNLVGYINKVAKITAGTWSGTGAEIRIGGANVEYCKGKIQAVAIYSTTLDTTQISELTDAINAL